MSGLSDRQGELKCHFGSRPGLAHHPTTPLQRTHPALHIVEAIAADSDHRVKSATIIAYLKSQNATRLPEANLDF